MKYIVILDEYLIGKFQIVLNFLQRIHYLSQVQYYRLLLLLDFVLEGLQYILGLASFYYVFASSITIITLFTMFIIFNMEEKLDNEKTANPCRYDNIMRIARLIVLILVIYSYTAEIFFHNNINIIEILCNLILLTAIYIMACDNLPKDKRKNFWENLDFAKQKTVTEN